MPQPEIALDLDELANAIVASIAAAFPVFQTVEAYREDRRSLPAPACLVQLVDLEPDPAADPGTEQLAVIARFEAQVVLGFREANARRAAPKLAAALALVLTMIKPMASLFGGTLRAMPMPLPRPWSGKALREQRQARWANLLGAATL